MNKKFEEREISGLQARTVADMPLDRRRTVLQGEPGPARLGPPNLRVFLRRRQLSGVQRRRKAIGRLQDTLKEILRRAPAARTTDLVFIPGGLDKPSMPVYETLPWFELHAKLHRIWRRVLMDGSEEDQRVFRRKLKRVELFCRAEVVLRLEELRRRLGALDFQAALIIHQIKAIREGVEVTRSDAMLVPA